jgi:hypothetical protein
VLVLGWVVTASRSPASVGICIGFSLRCTPMQGPHALEAFAGSRCSHRRRSAASLPAPSNMNAAEELAIGALAGAACPVCCEFDVYGVWLHLQSVRRRRSACASASSSAPPPAGSPSKKRSALDERRFQSRAEHVTRGSTERSCGCACARMRCAHFGCLLNRGCKIESSQGSFGHRPVHPGRWCVTCLFALAEVQSYSCCCR